jgi:hypothetical protein
LAGSVIRFVIDDPNAQLLEFGQIQSVVQNCAIYELKRPRTLERLFETADLLWELLAGTEPSRYQQGMP